MAIEVMRGGKTAPTWSGFGYNIKVSGVSDPARLSIFFEIASKGGGTTQIAVRVKPDSFDEVAAAMIKAAPKDAVRAFGKAMMKADLD